MIVADSPIEIETHGQQVGLGRAKDRFVVGQRMNPVEQNPCSVGPVPIEANGQIVVLAGVSTGKVEQRPASFCFPRSPAQAATCASSDAAAGSTCVAGAISTWKAPLTGALAVESDWALATLGESAALLISSITAAHRMAACCSCLIAPTDAVHRHDWTLFESVRSGGEL